MATSARPFEDYALTHPQLGAFVGSSGLLDEALATGSGVILDVGCGEGLTLELLRRRGLAARAVGTEVSLPRARASKARGFPVVVADATRLPFRDGSLGVVVCRHVIEHVPDDAALLAEAGRVVLEGGLVYLETPQRLPLAWYPHRNARGRRVLDRTHLREYATPESVEQLVARAGLVAERKALGPIRYLLSHLIARRTGHMRKVLAAAPKGLMISIPRYREIQMLARRPLARATSREPQLSVVVPVRNGRRTLEACLQSIRAQTEPVEVIVVDNGSTDGSRDIAAALADLVLDVGPERSAQRNAGAGKASSPFLLFVDADMVLAPDVAAAVLDAFTAPHQPDALVIPELSFGDGYWAACKALEKRLYLGDRYVEAARAFRREAFERVGRYDERLTAGEDWELHERLEAAGAMLGRVGARIYHDEGELRLAGTMRKKYVYGKTFARYAARSSIVRRRVLRGAFARKADRLAGSPLLAAGVLIMKVTEAAALAAGMAAAGRRPRAHRGEGAGPA